MKCLVLILSLFYFSPVKADVLKACSEPAIWPNLHNCFGSYTWKDGNKYVGEWQFGKMQDEFAEAEIESGRLVWLSELALTNFAYCISLPTSGNISAAAKIFRDWIRAKNF